MEEQRIGVYVCWCGTNIARMVDVEAVSESVEEMPNVVIAKNYKYMCSDPGQDMIIADIKEHNLNRVVVAACSPRIHEKTFRTALKNAGLNPYMFKMANIREQVSWVHEDRAQATAKAKSLVLAAITRVHFHEAIEKRTVKIDPVTMVIGAGIAGISAALEIADAGQQVYLVEKNPMPGGSYISTMPKESINDDYPHMDNVDQMVIETIRRVNGHPNINLLTDTKISEVHGYIGNFHGTLQSANGKEFELTFGNIVVATGLKDFDPSCLENYQYKKYADVITSRELENMLREGNVKMSTDKPWRGHTWKEPRHIAIIHCVGSRSAETHEYCSGTCCNAAVKNAARLKSILPDSHVYQLYTDMRTPGNGSEELYASTAQQGVIYMMFDKDDPPQVMEADENDECRMLVHMNEKLSGEAIEIPADMVVLMTGLEAQDDAAEISHLVGISMCGNDFYIEKHPKLDPVATTTEGVYIAGNCQAPKSIPDSIAQAQAAAARILAVISLGSVEIDVTTAIVNEELCSGCQTCISLCPYTALGYKKEEGVSEVNEALCKGCGTCGSSCPSGAICSRHFTDRQILSEIEGLLSRPMEVVS